jgi:hypothetical protein
MSLIIKSPDLALFGEQEIAVPGGLDFQGTSSPASYYRYADNWVKDLTSTSDITVSFWIKPDLVANEATYLIEAGAGGTTRQYIRVEANASTQLRISIRHTTNGGSDGITYASSYGSINNNAWNHVLYSFDYSANNLEVAINDTDQSASNAENGLNTFPGTTTADTYLGTLNNNSNYYDGCLTEFWMKDVYYDVSAESNRRRFISSNSLPVQLPAAPRVYLNGEGPTGSPGWNNAGSTDLGVETYNNVSTCADSPSD